MSPLDQFIGCYDVVRDLTCVAIAIAITLSPVASAGGASVLATSIAPAPTARPSLVRIPGGTFQMGSPTQSQPLTLENFIGNQPGADVAARSDEFPMHDVTISTFFMCRTEVTRRHLATALKQECAEDCDLPAVEVSWHDAARALNAITDTENAEFGTQLTRCYQGEDQEMTAVADCTGFRLPTEAEWEYAARAGRQSIWPHGDDAKTLKKYAWYSSNAKNKPHPVGKLKPNPWSLYDMFGNAGEWVSDWYGPYEAGSVTNPTGPIGGEFAILRGGSFVSVSRWSRAASRDKWGKSNQSIRSSGFRCARSAR
ncbi:MAG: formylglycine-generating enzyme family protein [Myxococcota bacterium]